MTQTIIIRDDDTSAFTPPELLERAYGRLWEHGIPVSLAVIPAPRGDVKVLHRAGQPYDPSIPPTHRGSSDRHPLTENPALCNYLNDKVQAGLVEICLHGYDHSYYEYERFPLDNLRQRLHDGLNSLQTALPAADIKSFIAPYDRLSPQAVDLVLESGLNLCTNTHSLSQTPYHDLPDYGQHTLDDDVRLYVCNDYFFNRHDAPEQGLALASERLQTCERLIIVNHYWTFYYDWAHEWDAMMAAWQTYVDQLLKRDDARFATFSTG